ncbi:myc-associated zinc finger protein isoform X1 [Xenopus laevis]|uniref:Myc-associated zinc finger protein n=1 Tax=Xenopus laevis TaxID=8355 RepID=A0A8J0U3D1_XENLA|nr:myc-associated zinc finger protein isoform X1 [Xenopus laevis]
MDANWSSFIFQTPPPPPAEPLQVELLPVLATVTSSPDGTLQSQTMVPTLATHHPSTVDTAALKQVVPGLSVSQQITPIVTPHHSSGPTALPLQPLMELPKKSKSRGPYICSLCSKEFKNGYNLRRHEAIHTGNKPARAAPSVDKITAMVPLSLLGVASALGTGTEGLEMPASPSTLSLPGPSPSAKKVRKNHACEMCGKAFRDVYHLNRHKLSHSDEKPYSCHVCQQRFKRKDRMTYHVRSHDGTVHKPYICSHCGKGFSRPDHLNSHVRQVHSTERPFKCQTCEAAFATKDRLRAHMVRHEEKVPCHVCGKLLSAAYITDHMKVHSQGPNHVCELCNKGFATAAYLRVHSVKHHGLVCPRADSFLCKLCSVHCKTLAQLSGHIRTHDMSGPNGLSDGSSLR